MPRQWRQPFDEPFSSLSDRFVAAQDDHIEGSEFQSHDRAVLFLPLVDSVPSVLGCSAHGREMWLTEATSSSLGVGEDSPGLATLVAQEENCEGAG
jgi:hypothetical protein